MNYQFKTVVVSGTFDRLHKGHQKLLHKALVCGRHVVCALTTPKMNQDKILPQTIQSFYTREELLTDFFKWRKAGRRTTIIPLSDRFGPTLQKTPIQAIIASKETAKTVALINQIRGDKNLPSLDKVILPLVQAQDQERLSSTRIRLGEITRQGRVFNLLFKNKNLHLPQTQRKYFRKPLGKLLKGNVNNSHWLAVLARKEINKQPTPLVITVGDIITRSFWQNRTKFSLAVVDYKSQRRPLISSFHQSLLEIVTQFEKVENQPGTISNRSFVKISQLLTELVLQKKQTVLQVSGEEDLIVLPLTLLAPLETLIFYGQPQEGIVKIRVTEKMKEKVYSLLRKFTSS